MAIVKSSTGKFYEMDDNALEGKEVKQEDLPKELQRPNPGMMGGGPGGLAGLIQVIVNVPPGGGPPPGEAGTQSQGAEGDVVGHQCGYWRNCWRNCF